MARSAASIQTEINAIEALLATSASMYTDAADAATSRSIDRPALEMRLSRLYAQYDRATGTPMFVRGRVQGLS